MQGDFGINQRLMEMLKQQSLSPLFIYVVYGSRMAYLEQVPRGQTSGRNQLRQSDLHIIIRQVS